MARLGRQRARKQRLGPIQTLLVAGFVVTVEDLEHEGGGDAGQSIDVVRLDLQRPLVEFARADHRRRRRGSIGDRLAAPDEVDGLRAFRPLALAAPGFGPSLVANYRRGSPRRSCDRPPAASAAIAAGAKVPATGLALIKYLSSPQAVPAIIKSGGADDAHREKIATRGPFRVKLRRTQLEHIESASLIGRSGSSAFRLSTNTVSMSLMGSCFSSESAPRPFHHEIEDEVEQSLPWPRRQMNGRSKRTRELTSSIVPRGTSFHRWVELAFPPIAF